jgi:predicted DNA-binding protein with PD1-like motif
LKTLPIRLGPGQDLRGALEAAVREHGGQAAFVIAGIGSLSDARIRFAGVDQAQTLAGDSEILSLSGTVGVDEAGHSHSHLHMAVSTASGAVFGGHVVPGCRVRTTAEVLLGLLPEWGFSREADPATGYPELVVRPNEA